ncbi:PilN domain-containing protein [Agarivorans sp.]|uniref:PilN domain-containing protein n=1 Tax=Agarivorans sp. TaxID=1872412 RepID=UPI003D014EE2
MKIRINLYTDEFRPQPERVSLRQAVLAWLLVGLLAVAAIFWQQGHTAALQQQAGAQKQRLAQQQQQLEQMKKAIEQRVVNASLQRQVEQAEQLLSMKRLLLQRLQGQAYTNKGFASFFSSLAAIEDQQVWLQHIHIDDGVLALAGRATSSDAVPKWLNQFKHYPPLARQQFSGLKLFRDEQQRLYFSLSGSTEAEAGGLND